MANVAYRIHRVAAKVGGRLREMSPRFYELVRQPWHRLEPLLGVDPYWVKRAHFNYYKEVVRLARAYVPSGGKVLDVGSGPTTMLDRFEWFEHRAALDPATNARAKGVAIFNVDFLTWKPPVVYDLVICLQVLEHIPEVETFARKLLATGRAVIVSVPYRWQYGLNRDHVHDPVDEAKLRVWMGRDPTESTIVMDDHERMVAVYVNARPAS